MVTREYLVRAIKLLLKKTFGLVFPNPFHIFMLIFCLASKNANGSQPQN